MTTSPPTDSVKTLVLRARGGDGQAVAELYTRFWRAARTAAYAVVRDFSTAEDVAAEAFRDALAAVPKLRDPDRFAPWLRRIVRRKAVVVARRAATQVALEQAGEMAADGTSQALEQRELARLVAQGVDRLPAAEREAILLYYFEGYSSADAARFTDVPLGTFRRRLHDGRVRLRKVVIDIETARASADTRTSALRTRVARVLSGKASAAQLYQVMRDVMLMRPVPQDLMATLGRRVAPPVGIETVAAKILVRSVPLLDDAAVLGDTARALRSALSEFAEWKVDLPRAMALWLKAPGATPGMSPPSFVTGQPGRYFRITRGLLFARGEDAVIDAAELLSRSGSLAALRGGMRQAMLSEVFDVYWIDRRSIALSEVEEWVMALAGRVVPESEKTCSVHRGPRYRTALRLDFAGDARPAAIGGVLTSWPGAPDDAQAVHVRIYVEPWAQQRSGKPVATQPIRADRAV